MAEKRCWNNKIHVDALDGSYEDLYVKLCLTVSVTAKRGFL